MNKVDNGTIKLSKLKPNPDNPRTIRGERMDLLITNLLTYPIFLRDRPIVHKNWMVLGGNMRLQGINRITRMDDTVFFETVHGLKLDIEIIDQWKAIRESKAIPAEWVANAEDYTEAQVKAFIIIDNAEFGDNNWDMMANGWDTDNLIAWGVEIPGWTKEKHDTLLTPEQTQVSFTASAKDKATVTHNDYALFEALLLNEDQKEAYAVVDEVRTAQGYEKNGEALMHIIRFYKKHCTKQ